VLDFYRLINHPVTMSDPYLQGNHFSLSENGKMLPADTREIIHFFKLIGTKKVAIMNKFVLFKSKFYTVSILGLFYGLWLNQLVVLNRNGI